MHLPSVRGHWKFALLSSVLVVVADAATFEVSSENDSGPGSLREAISFANASNGPDEITFAGGVSRIEPLTALPAVNDSSGGTTIEAARNVILDGALLPSDSTVDGILINSDFNTIHGLIIVNFTRFGIYIQRNGTLSITGNVVTGCWIGTDGSLDTLGNESGIGVSDGATQNRIGGPNLDHRNVISGNEFTGVSLLLATNTNNTVEGNYIGTDVSGSLPLGNGLYGIWIPQGMSNVVLGNVISGNGQYGIGLSGSFNTTVDGNLIGLGADGVTPMGNNEYGIAVLMGDSGSLLGGIPGGTGNTISSNTLGGILLADATGTVIAGNRIGTTTDGYTPAGTQGTGVVLTDASDCQIGDVANALGNTIAYHTEYGISGSSAAVTGISVRVNSIHSNGLEGISWTDGANSSADTPTFSRTNPIRGGTGLGHTVELFMDNDAEGRILIDTVVADAGTGVFESFVDLTRYNQLELTATATAPDGSTSEFSDIAVNDLLTTYHTADQSRNGSIELGELLRVIQLYNNGAFSCDEASEDGFAPGNGDRDCVPHHSDYDEQDWVVSLRELLRLVQFFTVGEYFNCPEVIPVTEDLYCPQLGA